MTLNELLLAVVGVLLLCLILLAWSAWDMRNVDLTPNKE